MAGPLRGGGGKGRAIKETRIFLGTFFFQRSKISTAIKLEGRGGPAIKKRFFFASFLILKKIANVHSLCLERHNHFKYPKI